MQVNAFWNAVLLRRTQEEPGPTVGVDVIGSLLCYKYRFIIHVMHADAVGGYDPERYQKSSRFGTRMNMKDTNRPVRAQPRVTRRSLHGVHCGGHVDMATACTANSGHEAN